MAHACELFWMVDCKGIEDRTCVHLRRVSSWWSLCTALSTKCHMYLSLLIYQTCSSLQGALVAATPGSNLSLHYFTAAGKLVDKDAGWYQQLPIWWRHWMWQRCRWVFGTTWSMNWRVTSTLCCNWYLLPLSVLSSCLRPLSLGDVVTDAAVISKMCPGLLGLYDQVMFDIFWPLVLCLQLSLRSPLAQPWLVLLPALKQVPRYMHGKIRDKACMLPATAPSNLFSLTGFH